MAPPPAAAVRALRASARGHLRIEDDRRWRARYVFDRRRGLLVFPMPGDSAGVTEAQLLVPDEHDPVVAALLSIKTVASAPGAAEIRFEVYHGRAHEALWAVATVEALRYHGEAYDRDEFSLTDPLAADEPTLCRELNADAAGLRAICEACAGARVEDPVVVGVDPDGLDVRARFGIVRVEFAERAETDDDARARIAQLLAVRPS